MHSLACAASAPRARRGALPPLAPREQRPPSLLVACYLPPSSAARVPLERRRRARLSLSATCAPAASQCSLSSTLSAHDTPQTLGRRPADTRRRRPSRTTAGTHRPHRAPQTHAEPRTCTRRSAQRTLGARGHAQCGGPAAIDPRHLPGRERARE